MGRALAPRANWKGFLKVAEVSCPVALYTAASKSERIAFHTLNRATGHRVRRLFVDSETRDPVEKEDQIKGYEVGTNEYVMLEPEEIAAASPAGDKTLRVSAFVDRQEVDDVYFDKPYYLTPADRFAEEAYQLLVAGMRASNAVAVAQAVLFRRLRTLLIYAESYGLVATTLNFNYEVRSADIAFDEIPDIRLNGEMIELAEHIINTKKGAFDPSKFSDRYEMALADLVKAKLEGKKIEIRKEPLQAKTTDLMAALRESAGIAPKKNRSTSPAKANSKSGGKSRDGGAGKAKASSTRRKAS